MRFRLESELDNDAMQTGADVIKAIQESLKGEEKLKLEEGTAGILWDESGNIVGKWQVNKRRTLTEIFAAIPVTVPPTAANEHAMQGYCITEDELAAERENLSPEDHATLDAIPAALPAGSPAPPRSAAAFIAECNRRKAQGNPPPAPDDPFWKK